MMAKYTLILVSLCAVILAQRCVGSAPYCPQLGCDGAGTFTQAGFEIPTDGKRTVAWVSSSSSFEMNPENENYGCVGSSKVVVCPHRTQANGSSRHMMLNTVTGEEYDTTGYATLENVNMPILTKDNLVFATNSTHVSLVDPLNGRSYITKLSTHNHQGMHSSIYLPKLDMFVVLGNFSTAHSVYKVVIGVEGLSELTLLTTFSIEKAGKTCPWLPTTELTANGNRAYFYGYHVAEIGGIVAIEFMAEAPYYKKVWELSDEMSGNMLTVKQEGIYKDADNCTVVPEIDPEYSIFPPVDVNTQMIATPDKYIVITTPVGLITVKDHGDSGEQVAISLFGAHFLSLDTSPVENGGPPMVWMTGWPIYPPFREYAIAYNYSDLTTGNSIWTIDLAVYLQVDDLNITSRINTFDNPSSKDSKVLVFGVSVNNTKSNSTFQTKYCQGCELGINNLLMAVRSEYKETADPTVYWMAKVSNSTKMEVKGQVIGVSNKLVMYVKDGNTGKVVALK